MNKLITLFLVLSLVSVTWAGYPATLLFNDTFDRSIALQNNLNASTDGMSGLLAPLAYVESGDVLGESDGLTNIENNQLHLADGPNMTVMYLDHNFIDSAILADGSLRIGLTIVSNDGTTTTINHYTGFGIGNTLAECQAANFDYNNPGFRGRVDNYPGTSDFWVGWSPNSGGTIQIFKNGPTSHGGENYDARTGVALTGNDRLELELYLTDFKAGSVVQAFVLWNSEIVVADSFVWDNDDSNYLGFTTRQNNAGFTADNLTIETVYNPRAQKPVPAYSATGITPGPVTLQWDKGKDAAGQPNADITKHYLSVTTSLVNGEPNFTGPAAMYVAQEVADTADPVSFGPITVNYDDVVYWRVDESVNNSGPAEPNTVTGEVWFFKALKSFPVITTQPAHTAAFPDDPTALSVVVTSISPASYAWYKTADYAADTPADDVQVGADSASYDIASTALDDEGYYYCVITNDGGQAVSDVVYLTVKRKVLYWAFENDFQDSSGEGNHGTTDPNFTPPTFVAEVPGAVGSYAASFDGVSNRVTHTLAPDNKTFYSGFTLTLWAKAAVVPQPINSAMFNNNNGGPQDFQLDFNGNGLFRYQGSNNQVLGDPTTEWTHFAVVCDGMQTTIYVNLDGDTQALSTGADIIFGQYQAGCNRAGDVFFNGLIDDVQVWNYPVAYEDLATDYLAVTGKGACLDRPDWDLNNDCVVDLGDMVEFVQTWLNCGLYPQFECY